MVPTTLAMVKNEFAVVHGRDLDTPFDQDAVITT